MSTALSLSQSHCPGIYCILKLHSCHLCLWFLQGLGLFVRASDSLQESAELCSIGGKVPCLSLNCILICSTDEKRLFFIISLEE